MKNFSWFHCQALEVQFFTSLSVGRLLRCQTLTLFCLHLGIRKMCYSATLALIIFANSNKSALQLPSRTSFPLREIETFTLLNMQLPHKSSLKWDFWYIYLNFSWFLLYLRSPTCCWWSTAASTSPSTSWRAGRGSAKGGTPEEETTRWAFNSQTSDQFLYR